MGVDTKEPGDDCVGGTNGYQINENKTQIFMYSKMLIERCVG